MMMWRYLMLFTLLATMVRGQEAEPPAKPKGAHQVRFLCVEALPGLDKLVVMEKSDEGWVPRWRFTVSSAFLTDPLGVDSKVLALGIDPAPPAGNNGFNGPPLPITEALTVVPFQEFRIEGSETATAVLIAGAGDAAKTRPYRVVMLETDAARFGAGSILVQNFSPALVAGKFGGKAAQVAPGKSAVVVPGIDQAADMAQITLARQVETGWEAFCDTRWPAKVDYRRYLLLLPRPDGSVFPFVMPEYPPFR